MPDGHVDALVGRPWHERWPRESPSLGGPASPTLARLSPVQAPRRRRRQGGPFGCCGGGVEEEEDDDGSGAAVAAKLLVDGRAAAEALKPQDVTVGVEELEGLDGLSWAPLLLPRAPKKAELLLALALHGGYADGAVCDAVATQVCAADPAASAEYLHLLLASDPPAGRGALGPIADCLRSPFFTASIAPSTRQIQRPGVGRRARSVL